MLPEVHAAETDVCFATELKATCAAGSQTETTVEEMDVLFQSTTHLLVEKQQLTASVSERVLFSCFTKDDDVCFYTELPSVKMLNCVFAHFSAGTPIRQKLTPCKK